MTMLIGRVLGDRYQLGGLLGVGGMASVYEATDRVLDRRVAVKVLGAPYDRNPEFVRHFRHEARMAAGLSHPGVVAIFDSASDGDLHYIVMEHVHGQTLAELLRQRGPLPPRQAAAVAQRVCQALAAAHERGLVHRDVKPANVMVDQSGTVKVMDFGIARSLAAGRAGGVEAALLGTAAYLSPEQGQGGTVDGRSDLYALGCVLYELLTGTPPFAGDSPSEVVARHLRDPAMPPSHRSPQVGPELDAVVLTALAKQPSRRYQSAAEMGQALTRCGGGSGGPVPLGSAPGGVPVGSARGGVGTRTAGSASAATTVIAGRAVRGRGRRPVWAGWLLAGVAAVALVAAIMMWSLRDGGTAQPQAGLGVTASSTPSTSSTPPTMSTPPTTALTSAPASSVSGALANFADVIATGQREGMIDEDGEELVKQAEEIAHAAQEGHRGEVRRKLRDLERKADELIHDGQISPPATGAVRQALAQFETAVRRSADAEQNG